MSSYRQRSKVAGCDTAIDTEAARNIGIIKIEGTCKAQIASESISDGEIIRRCAADIKSNGESDCSVIIYNVLLFAGDFAVFELDGYIGNTFKLNDNLALAVCE